MASVTTYSVSSYGLMIHDRVRVDGYARALQAAVGADSAVLDIGTGTGIFALLACKYGARKVYAVEPSSAIEIARQTAELNGLAGRIAFIQDLSTRIELPERVDVIVSNIGGVLPLFEHHIPVIADARRRFLKPGGTLIPRQDHLFAAIAEAPDAYSRAVAPWEDNPYGLDLSPGREIAVNSWIKNRVSAAQLLVEPAPCGSIDYTAAVDTGFCAQLNWEVQRSGVAHALVAWFDSTLGEAVSISNAPSAPETIFGNAFFPLREPVPVAAGDRITVQLRATFVDDDYVWNWDTEFRGSQSISFQQSTFFAEPVSPSEIRKKSSDFRPTRSEDAELEFVALGMMDGQSSLQDIAERLFTLFPRRFKSVHEALVHAGMISQFLSA